MSNTLLERARLSLEEMDALEGAAVEALTTKASGAKAVSERDHLVSKASKEVQERARNLKRLYDQSDLREEVSSFRGSAVFANFYGALKDTREYHARYGDALDGGVLVRSDDDAADAADRVRREAESVSFSGEEVWGKYVDMSTLHQEFCQVVVSQLDYAAYLRMLLNRPFSTLVDDRALKSSSQYARYVHNVDAYLCDFWRRANPLVDLDEALQDQRQQQQQNDEAEKDGGGDQHLIIDLEPFHSAEELLALGADRLKAGLRALGLKCGGDAKARAKRLFSTKGLAPDEIDPRLKKKKQTATASSSSSSGGGGLKQRVEEAEARIETLVGKLGPTIESSLRRAERKFTRTKDEIEQELRDEAFGPQVVEDMDDDEEEKKDFDDDDDDAAPPLYNPKNLPLGWDGKPIPYWLYKLHGLDQTFKCEICGNFTYYGRRAFEQHFTEWRHAHGMRCLRIPNSKHFHGVTNMEDAVALWEQLQERADKERFNAARDEEYEDSEGNVLNRATYEDLARQGLL